MTVDDKRQRDLELLRKSRRALDEGELVDRHAAPEPSRADGARPASPAPATPAAAASAAPADDDEYEVVMYRGKPIKRRKSSSGGAGSRIPGAKGGSGQRATQFRGTSTEKKPAGKGDIRAVLERLNDLYKDGLITKNEYDRKRQQVLDRL